MKTPVTYGLILHRVGRLAFVCDPAFMRTINLPCVPYEKDDLARQQTDVNVYGKVGDGRGRK